MSQAASIISLATHIDVKSKDPYVVSIHVKNNSLVHGWYYPVGFILGKYHPDEQAFYCLAFTADGKVWLVGRYWSCQMCEVGVDRGYGMPTYAPIVSQVLEEDALAFVMPAGTDLPVYRVNWGGKISPDVENGNWVIGVGRDVFFWFLNNKKLEGLGIFPNVITISP